MTIQPQHDYVLIRKINSPDRKDGSIIITTRDLNTMYYAEVLAQGSKVQGDYVGKKIILNIGTSTQNVIDADFGEQLIVEKSILGVLVD